MRFKKENRKEAIREAKKLLKEYDIIDAGGLQLIQTFTDAYSTEMNAQDIVTLEGLVFKDRFDQVKAHPLCSVIRDARAQKMAALKALNLDLEPLSDRPGRK